MASASRFTVWVRIVFFFQGEDGMRDLTVTGVQTCALPISTDTAIEAMKLGAYDYLVKPLDPDRLQELVARTASMSQLMRVPIEGGPAEPGSQLPYALVGNSPAMQEVYKAIGRVAPMDLTVL